MDRQVKAAVKKVLESYPAIRLAIVFGSMAANAARSDSDFDIAVDTGRPLSVTDKMALIGKLAVATGRPVDLVDLHMAGEPLLGQILRHGERVIGVDACFASLISKHVFNQADFVPYRNRILDQRRHAWIGT